MRAQEILAVLLMAGIAHADGNGGVLQSRTGLAGSDKGNVRERPVDQGNTIEYSTLNLGGGANTGTSGGSGGKGGGANGSDGDTLIVPPSPTGGPGGQFQTLGGPERPPPGVPSPTAALLGVIGLACLGLRRGRRPRVN